MRKRYPGITFDVHDGTSADLKEHFARGFYDFLLDCDSAENAEFNQLVLPVRDVWGVVMRQDDPLAEKESFSVSDLKGLPLICSKQWVDQEFPQWFQSDLGDVNIVATYNLPFNGAVMAKAGMGYALMLDNLVNTSAGSGILFRPLLNVPDAEMYVIWKKYQVFTPIAELLLNELQASFR